MPKITKQVRAKKEQEIQKATDTSKPVEEASNLWTQVSNSGKNKGKSVIQVGTCENLMLESFVTMILKHLGFGTIVK